MDGTGRAEPTSLAPHQPQSAADAGLGFETSCATPLVRAADGRLTPIDWDGAVRAFAAGFKDLQATHGPESVAFLTAGCLVTEELALLGALAKFGMGMLHGGDVDPVAAASAAACQQAFGFDAPPCTYGDLEASDVLVLVGSDLREAQPALWQRVVGSRCQPRIIVVDPRKTATALGAADHLALRPGSDAHLFAGLAHILIRQNWFDRAFIDAHTDGFDAFVGHVRDFTPEAVADRTGIEVDTLYDVALAIRHGRRVSFWWGPGVSGGGDGVDAAAAIINLALMTGHVGRPGAGANPIPGRADAAGWRLFSNTSSLLGGRDFQNPGDCATVADVLGIDIARIPCRSGLACDQIIDAIDAGRIKGLWLIAADAPQVWMDHQPLAHAMEKLGFLVVQHAVGKADNAALDHAHRHAHLVLPVAGGDRKEGTLVNAERRISVVRPTGDPSGQPPGDFAVFKRIAQAWGCADMFNAWSSPWAVFQIIKQLSSGQPCDVTGVSDDWLIEAHGGIQWPFTERDAAKGPPPPQRRLFEDGRFFHQGARARFVCAAPGSLA